MQIKDIILDAIRHSRLYEMARNREDALNKLSQLDHNIDEHLLKILIYGKCQSYNHWCKELNNWLREVNSIKVKPSKKRLSLETLRQYLWEHNFESVEEVEDWITSVDRRYRKNYRIVNGDPASVHQQLEDILYDICFDLAQGQLRNIKYYLEKGYNG